MQPWFLDAKLGIFIHYGIYAVNGISESWSFFNGQISHEDYMKQLDGFTASAYDPEEWADLFARAGAQYAVLTTKHHDGVALWDTKANDLSVVNKTPAGRDLVTPFVEALRKHGLRVGLYYSHLDWSHPDYPTLRKVEDGTKDLNPFAGPPAGHEDPERWANFLKFHRAQLEELCTQFGKVDLHWFDGDWEREPEQFQMKELRDQLHAWQPEVILNSRMLGYGDYATPEQGQPVVAPDGVWEFCVTINDSWGYQTQDHNHKPTREIVRMFAEVIGMGGNVLLDVGPFADGSLQPEQVQRLEELGTWTHKHAEAIYGSVAGLPLGLHYGPSTLSKDGQTLYLILLDRPVEKVYVKGIRNNVKAVSVVGNGTALKFTKPKMVEWTGVPGTLVIDVPEHELDTYATVLKVELEGKIETMLGKGRD
ncbi:MAG: alpha-L-fucosidase [Fimbriimonas sp.]